MGFSQQNSADTVLIGRDKMTIEKFMDDKQINEFSVETDNTENIRQAIHSLQTLCSESVLRMIYLLGIFFVTMVLELSFVVAESLSTDDTQFNIFQELQQLQINFSRNIKSCSVRIDISCSFYWNPSYSHRCLFLFFNSLNDFNATVYY
ncbi:unnamed protein product [Trichobilharzia szidati]|nr:unnamed protein product [Trichobilharzia szidati]